MRTSVEIRAVVFDMGGTLEDVYYDDDWRLKATPGFREILAKHDLDPGLSIPDLYAVIKAGMTKYGAWREKTEQEMPPEQVWSRFVFKKNQGWPKEKLAAIGEELAFYWDTRFSHRMLRPESREVLAALHGRGFRLGVISNILSRQMVPFKLDEYGLTRYFPVVLASASFGWRKPSPHIFLEATRLLDLPPAACAYVGDTVSRDVIGARRAGYGLVIQIKSFLTGMADKASVTEQPDAVVQNLMEVVDLVTLS